MNNTLKIFLLIPTMGILSACGDIELAKLGSTTIYSTSTGTFQVDPPKDINRPTKFLFVVDKSDSNDIWNDTNDTLRYNSVNSFYQEHKGNPLYKWGLDVYVNSAAKAYIKNPTFSDDEEVISAAIDKIRSEEDDGSTPYSKALELVRTQIRNDLRENEDENAIYMIFFISDGMPDELTQGIDGEPPMTIEDIAEMVRDIIRLKRDSIFMSTAYYGQQNGIEVLEQMADAGGGRFVNINETGELDFNDLIVGPTKEPWQIKNSMLMVYNTNSSTCLDGNMGVDSDSDGMCDIDERRYGLDPQKRFSIHSITNSNGDSIDVSGYGDYFQWRRIEYGESLRECSDRSDEDHDLLTFCEEKHLYEVSPDICYDNQVVWYKGNPLNPDTDLDGILDGIEIYMFKDKSSALNCNNLSYSYDGEADSAETQIRQHRNPLIWDPDAYAYDVQIQPIGYENGSIIYSYTQSRLELFNTLQVKKEDTIPGLQHKADKNVVLVYYIQTPQNDSNGPGILKFSIQKLVADQRINDSRGTAAGVNLNRPFNEYRIPASN